TILMVPTYVLISSQYTALQSRFNDMREKQEALESAEAEIIAVNTLAEYIDEFDTAVRPLSLIDEIDALAGEEIRVVRYGFAQSARRVSPFTIGGVATNRSALTAFRDRLEETARFKEVKLPIESLAADRDVSFSIELTVVPEE